MPLHTPKDTEIVFKDKNEVEKLDTQNKIIIAWQPYLKSSDFVKYGLTRGCPKCDHEINYGPWRTSKPHSQTCRKRTLAEIAKTPEGKARIVQASDRPDRTVTEPGGMHRTDAPQGEEEGMVLHQTP